MPKFSKASKDKLNTCDKKLQDIFNEVIKTWDCTIIYGYRNKEEQNKAFKQGKSKLTYPHSKHNTFPSQAVDVIPYFKKIGLDWEDYIACAYFAGYVKRVAYEKGINIRWGGDWDNDHYNKDQTFNDFVHFELI